MVVNQSGIKTKKRKMERKKRLTNENKKEERSGRQHRKKNVQRKAYALDIYVRGKHTYYKEAFISITNNNITNRLLIFHTSYNRTAQFGSFAAI